MKTTCITVLVLSLRLLSAGAQATSPLTLERTIKLPGVTGKFDHFAIDEAGGRLFAAAAGNHSVEVIDLSSGKVTQSLAGLGKPHGLAWMGERGRLFVADGAKGELEIFSGSPFKLEKTIKLAEDADDMVYDPESRMLYVGDGGTDAANPSAVAVIDTAKLELVQTLPMKAHPEGLELDEHGRRVFVNISDTGEIAVIDADTHSLSGTWRLNQEEGNTPLAFDAADNLLLTGCRTPAKLLVLQAKSGTEMASASSDTGADDLFYEPSSHRAYLVTGSGAVDSYLVSPEGKLQPLAVTKTPVGAKTGLLVSSQGALYLGVPGSSASSEIRVYKTSAK